MTPPSDPVQGITRSLHHGIRIEVITIHKVRKDHRQNCVAPTSESQAGVGIQFIQQPRHAEYPQSREHLEKSISRQLHAATTEVTINDVWPSLTKSTPEGTRLPVTKPLPRHVLTPDAHAQAVNLRGWNLGCVSRHVMLTLTNVTWKVQVHLTLD